MNPVGMSTSVARQRGFSLAGHGFGRLEASDLAANGFVGTGMQSGVDAPAAWHGTAPLGVHVMHVAKPATSKRALMETPAAELAATKRTRIFGVANAAKDVDYGVEGTVRRGVPV